MSVISSKTVLKKAQQEGYAIPAFSTRNLETLQVVAETAAELRSPPTVAGAPGAFSYAGVGNIVAAASELARSWNHPLAVHLGHHESTTGIEAKVTTGIRSVVIDSSHLPPADDTALVKHVTDCCHRYDVSAEAGLRRLGRQGDDLIVDGEDTLYTHPEQVREFVEKMGINSLAVAIGTTHSLYDTESKLNFDRLAEIHQHADIPLVLHGASGLPTYDTKRAISLGVCKVNVAVGLKIVFTDALKTYLSTCTNANDSRHYMMLAKAAMKEVARRVIADCGCEGKL